MSRVWSRLKARPILSGAFLLALAVMVFFGARLVLSGIYWSDPAHRDQTIALWMTPGYVVHSWQIPREVMRTALGPPPEDGKRETLAEIAKRLGEDPAVVIARIEAEIAAYRAGQGE